MENTNPLEITQNPQQQLAYNNAKDQLNVDTHRVMLTAYRPDKKVVVPTGELDDEGKEITKTKIEDVNRIPVPFQNIIVNRRVAFMNVKNIRLVADFEHDTPEERLYKFVNKIREDNKIMYKEVVVAKKLLRDLQVAKLYYFEKTDKKQYGELNHGNSKLRMRVKVIAPSLGDTLIPVFDEFGSMAMFIRKYTNTNDDNVTEVFTNEYINVYVNNELSELSGKNEFGKIPISYYEMEETIWNDVQPIINRFETLISNFADTIDYNGSPILKATGEIKGFATRGERGKTFELEEGADLQYLSWDSAPDAIKLELTTLKELIFSCTQTPDISFEQMKGLGGITGVGMDRVFLDAQLGANDIIDGVYGEITQRDINLQIAGAQHIDSSLAGIDSFDIWFELDAFRFNDIRATVDTLTVAYQAGLMSQQTAVMNNPIVEGNGEEEYQRILEENGSLSFTQAEEEEEV